jgi:hypothetical protein
MLDALRGVYKNFQKIALPKENLIMWTRLQAEQFLHSLQPILIQAGYTGQIVGSVAIHGQSSHDLDIQLNVIPQREQQDNFDSEILTNYFEAQGWHWQPTGGFEFDESDCIEIHLPGNRIVDFFF